MSAVRCAVERRCWTRWRTTEGPLRDRASRELVGASASGSAPTTALRAKLDTWLADFAVSAVRRYGDELTAVITHTIERWDGREAARKIELHVGRDLQFIRINGTIVGGLVGVLIHASLTGALRRARWTT